MTCFTRPTRIVCPCGRKVEVGLKGPIPSRCYQCVNEGANPERVTSIRCVDCGKKVPVKLRGGTRLRCDDCRKKVALKQSNDCKKRQKAERLEGKLPPAKKEVEELGPERPELGMTPEEKMAWRDERILALFVTEPELPVSALAERFDVSRQAVLTVLHRAGHGVRERGRDLLPAGPPVR